MLNGRIYLTQNPPWLNELIPVGGHYFVAYPPMPAIISIPFVAVFGTGWQQQILAHITGALLALLSFRLGYAISHKKSVAIWSGLFMAFATPVWYMSAAGSAWYLGQLTAAMFLTAAVYTTLTNKNLEVTGLLIGGAYLARIHTILSLPFFVFMIAKKPYISKSNLKKIFTLVLGITPFILFNFWYNYARFGVIWDKGYTLIPRVLEEPWYKLGIIHPSYIGRHLKVIFIALPRFQDKFPFALPTWGGLAVWITTPALFVLYKTPLKDKTVKLALLGATLIAIPVLMHGTTGFAQFGYRFAVDFYPLLLVPVIKSLGRRPGKLAWALLIISMLVNLWGVLWIKNGYVI